jgi:hypothetical protein
MAARTRAKSGTWDDEDSFARLMTRELGKLVSQAKPWAIWPVLLLAGFVTHHFWPGGWTGLGVACAAILVSSLVIHLNHAAGRKHFGRLMYPAITLGAGGWLAWVAWTGIHSPQMASWFIGGITISTCWDVWVAAHADVQQPDVVTSFEAGAAKAGIALRLRSVKILPRKITGVLHTPPGSITHEALAKTVGLIEAGRELPPGSISIAPDKDNAARHLVTISDPRVLRDAVPWPGPSRPGKSIAEPLRYGLWQDSEDCDVTVTGYHAQWMGMTGAGKTESALWTEVGETVTRHDAAVILFDITKGRQFGGPLEPALHALLTDPAEALEWMQRLHQARLARTNYLETIGLTKWVEGCGLTHLTVWYEEVYDVIEQFSKADLYETWESDVKADRSAGKRNVLSLQRADYTQMPTIVRGQLAKGCFGVDSPQDADFGLSPYQRNHDCQPELWGTSQPGMAYLDTPAIRETYRSMPMRWYWWGPDTSLIGEHCARYPASDRPLDHITGPILFPGTTGVRLPVTVKIPEHLRRPSRIPPLPPAPLVEPPELAHASWDDDDPSDIEDDDMLTRRDPEPRDPDADEPIEIPAGHEAAGYVFDTRPAAEPADPDLARRTFRSWLARQHAGGTRTIGVADALPVRDQVGRSRGWLYTQFEEAVTDGLLVPAGGFPTKWTITNAAA